jgi:hypothetical protein
MNANELAQEFEEYLKEIEELPWGNHQILCDQASTMLRKQAEEIEYWKDKFEKAMDLHNLKPAKYTDEWWKEVAEFNKQLKAQEK